MLYYFFAVPPTDCSGVGGRDWWWRDHAGGRSARCSSGKGEGGGGSPTALLLRADQSQIPGCQSVPSDPRWPAQAQRLWEIPRHNQTGASNKRKLKIKLGSYDVVTFSLSSYPSAAVFHVGIFTCRASCWCASELKNSKCVCLSLVWVEVSTPLFGPPPPTPALCILTTPPLTSST